MNLLSAMADSYRKHRGTENIFETGKVDRTSLGSHKSTMPSLSLQITVQRRYFRTFA